MQARRHRRPLAVLFVDLDRFKVINDTLGHDAGDELLREVARRMSSGVRDSDTVARLGGDEFVVLLEEIASPAVVRVVAQRLVVALGRSADVASRELNVTASIGVSVYPADGEDSQALLKNADIAMYRAKERGRNAIQFYSAGQEVHSIERLTLESDLRRALERNELLLHYQPLIDVRRNRLTGFEALVRWQHPERGLVSPADFIPIAEETGLIVPIGEWVLATACATHGAWRQRGLPDVRMSVNLSARQLMNADLLDDFAPHFQAGPLHAVLAGPRAHREHGHGRSRACDRLPRAVRHWGFADARRFRHRLLVARLSAALADRRAQDRPIVHRGGFPASRAAWRSRGR